MPHSNMSEISSHDGSDADNGDVANMILDEPMYYILSQFFETDDHKNVATLLQELVQVLRELKNVISSTSLATSSSQA